MKEQIYSMIGIYPAPQLMSGMYIRHSRIYSRYRMISDTVGYKQVKRKNGQEYCYRRIQPGIHARQLREVDLNHMFEVEIFVKEMIK